jgi:hypothetical protein
MGHLLAAHQRVGHAVEVVGFGSHSNQPFGVAEHVRVDETDHTHHPVPAQPVVAAGHVLFRYAEHLADTAERHPWMKLKGVKNTAINRLDHGDFLWYSLLRQ